MESCTVITVSDRSAAGERADLTGPLLADQLQQAGYRVENQLIPDGEASVGAAIRTAARRSRVVITTGGTGVGPRDRTPEGTRPELAWELPGIPELLRAEGRAVAPHAVLSRGLAGVIDTGQGAFVLNLPGNPKAATEGLALVLPLLPHLLDQLSGGDH